MKISVLIMLALLCLSSSVEVAKKKKVSLQSNSQLLSKMESHKVSAKQKKAMNKASLSAEASKKAGLKSMKVGSGSVSMVKAEFIIPQNATCSQFDSQPYICTSVPSCGWCSYTQQCLNGDFYGAVNNLCKWYYFVYDRSIWTRFPRYSPWTRTIVPVYYTYYDYGSPFRYSSYYYRPYHTYYRSAYYHPYTTYATRVVAPVRRVYYK